MQGALISIGKTAQMLGISIDTLRRWDVAEKLQPIRSSSRGHRYYLQSDIEQFLHEKHIVPKWIRYSDLNKQPWDIFEVSL